MQQPRGFGRRALGLLRQLDRFLLQKEPRHQHQDTAKHQHPDDIPRYAGHEEEEHEDKGDIRDRANGRRGKEFTHRPEFAHRGKQLVRGLAARVGPHPQQPAHQDVLHRQLDLPPCPIHQTRPRHLEESFHEQREPRTGGEHPKRRFGLMRDHAVIDLQGKQRHSDGQQVGHERPRRDLYQLAAKARKLPPEPMRRRAIGLMGFGHGFQRGFGPQDQPRKEGFEIADRHHRAIVGACRVIQDQIATLLPHDKQDLPRGHIGQRRPHILGNPPRPADLCHQPCAFHPAGQCFGFYLRIIALQGGRGDDVKDVAWRGGDAQQSGIGRGQFGPRHQTVFGAVGVLCLGLGGIRRRHPTLIAVGDCQRKGRLLGQIALPSANTPCICAISIFRRTASYLRLICDCC